MDMDIIDKDYNKTWMTIYEKIHKNYFKELKLFTDGFLEQCKINKNLPQNIPYET